MQTPETTAAASAARAEQLAAHPSQVRSLATQARSHGITHTRAILARGNHLAAQNDEAEPTFRDIEAQANADARAILRGHQP